MRQGPRLHVKLELLHKLTPNSFTNRSICPTTDRRTDRQRTDGQTDAHTHTFLFVGAWALVIILKLTLAVHTRDK